MRARNKKILNIFAGLLLFMMMNLPAFCNPAIKIQSWSTDNGARVLFSETHQIPMLNIQVSFDAGSARDGTFFGIANFTNAMLDEGTKTMSTDEIAEAFDKVGAQYAADVNRDMAIVSLRTLTDPKLLDSALQTFIEVLSEPSFPQQAFSRVQGQLLSGLEAEQQQPSAIMSKDFFKMLYGDQPYGHPTSGNKEDIQAIAPYNLQQFYDKYYVAKNALVVIVGDVTLAQAKDMANKITSKLKSGAEASKLQMSTAQVKTAQKLQDHINFPSEQTHIAIGQIGIAKNDPDFFPLLLGNYILGQSPLSSELFQEVRDKRGLAYSVGSDFVTLKSPGPFVIVLQTRTDRAAESITVARTVLRNFLQQGPTEQQLVAAKKSVIGQFPLKIADNSSISGALNIIGFYNLPLDYLDTYTAKVNAVTLPQIQDAFKSHINFDQMVTVTVGR